MRQYYGQTKELKQVICNCCGRELRVEQGILKEGACHLETGWGYFPGKIWKDTLSTSVKHVTIRSSPNLLFL